MLRFAVTGGAGFIGRAVVAELRGRGHETVAVDLPDDVRTLAGLPAGADHVVHLAGVLGTSELFGNPRHAIDVNMAGTANILRAAVDAGAGYTGITLPQVFPSVYQATKTGARELERAWFHGFGLPVSRVRAFNAFGAGQKHGDAHPKKIIPVFATAAWAGKPVTVYGDGEQVVDLIDTAQLARIIADAAAHGGDVTFDGGTGEAFTVNQVAAMVLDITGSKSPVVHVPMRIGEIPRKVPGPVGGAWGSASPTATGEGWDLLGWKPSFNPQALSEAVESYRLVAA